MDKGTLKNFQEKKGRNFSQIPHSYLYHQYREKKKRFLGNSLAFCSKASHHIMISRKIVLTFNKEIKHFYVENRHKYSFSLRNDTRGYN